jgi:hypothetical protein
MAEIWATRGCDVLLEGLSLSREHERTARLAAQHRLHILLLSTSPKEAARRLAARRRAGRRALPLLTERAEAEEQLIGAACRRLEDDACVERLGLGAAYSRARDLLGLSPLGATDARPASGPAIPARRRERRWP